MTARTRSTVPLASCRNLTPRVGGAGLHQFAATMAAGSEYSMDLTPSWLAGVPADCAADDLPA